MFTFGTVNKITNTGEDQKRDKMKMTSNMMQSFV